MSLSGITDSAAGGLINFGQFAQAAEIVVGGTSYLADFYGNIKFLLDPNILSQFLSGAVSIVPLLIQEHVNDGIGNIIGPITMRMDPDRDPPQSTITAIVPGMPFPAIEDHIFNVQVTIPNLLPGITLRNKISDDSSPAIFRNSNVTNFPPQNDVYNLVAPIDLEDVNNPGPVLATIKSFPLTVNPATP